MTYFCSKTPQIHVFVTKHKMRKNCQAAELDIPDEDKEEDEGDDGEGEHQDPPEQSSAGLAAVQAVSTGQSQPVWRLPANIISF